MQGKQAKIVSPTQERAILGYLDTTRSPSRDRVMFLLSMKAGLRAKEMASLTWAMVTDAQGQIAEAMHVPNRASKGTTGGRTIPLHPDLQAALGTLQTGRGDMATPERLILFSERGGGLSPATVRLWFHRLYTSLHMDGFVANLHLRRFVLWSLPVTYDAQRGRTTMAISFKGAHFPPDIILMGVRWYVAYP